ncbi:MAG: alpha/beta fold hydrolase, partial [Planctomycetia bacterium]
ALFAFGDQDHLMPVDIGRKLYAAAPEPKMFVLLRGQGHDEDGGSIFFAELKQFLDDNPPAPPVQPPAPATETSVVSPVFDRWFTTVFLCGLVLFYIVRLLRAALYRLERSLLYHPTPAATEFFAPPSPLIQDVFLKTKSGVALHAWWRPTEVEPSETPAVLYLHGNAGNLSCRGMSIEEWVRETGSPVFIVDYPGYGKSGGAPSEQGCYEAGEASLEWLAANGYPAERVVLMGTSLGGGVAVELALRHPTCRALVVVKSFLSIPDMARRLYPSIPLHLVVRDRFDNHAKVGRLKPPALYAYGDRDVLIPLDVGRALFAAAADPKRFVLLKGQDHDENGGSYFFAELRRFLNDFPPSEPEA